MSDNFYIPNKIANPTQMIHAAESGTSITVEAVQNLVLSALHIGVTYLTKHTLPSQWSKKGCGWQEVWQKATRAGVYASCDGILLLDNLPFANSINVEGLIKSVYEHHLCLVMDPQVKSQNHSSDSIRKRQICTSTTMYVSKFLQSSFNQFCFPNSKLVRRYLKRIASVPSTNKGVWPCSLSPNDSVPQLCATAEALIALSRSGEYNNIIDLGMTFLRNMIHSPDESRRRRVALWAISQLWRHAKEKLIIDAANIIAQEWEIYQDRDDDLEVTKYWNVVTDENAYYSYDVRLVFAQATLVFLMHRRLDIIYFRYVLPIVEKVASRLIANDGVYTPVQFWQHYQAVELLSTFIAAINKNAELLKESYVLVKPSHFHKQTFSIEPQLGVVLMPFRSKWSNDVYRVFETVLQRKGFRCWRADVEKKDDAIMQTIWEYINKAKFIIADCTEKNPNVFYELGIADTIGKPIFRCAQNEKHFPFDISGLRRYVYGTLPNDLKKLKKELGAFIDEIK